MTGGEFELVEDRSRTVLPALLTACPSFRDKWDAHLADWGDDSAGQYIAIGEFARHLVEQLQREATSELPAVFAAVETLLAADEVGVRELVTVGLIEDIQNVAADQGGWPLAGRFRPYLGPLTALAWDEVHRFWGTIDGAGPDDTPAR